MKPAISLLLACLLIGCGVQSAATAAPESNDAAAGTVVDSLPLERGFFVDARIACAQASDATVRLHYGSGFGGARDNCDFDRIVKNGENTYVATQTCTDLMSGRSDTSSVAFEVGSRTAFRAFNAEYDWRYAARHCPQTQLPEPWRSNDISDLE